MKNIHVVDCPNGDIEVEINGVPVMKMTQTEAEDLCFKLQCIEQDRYQTWRESLLGME